MRKRFHVENVRGREACYRRPFSSSPASALTGGGPSQLAQPQGEGPWFVPDVVKAFRMGNKRYHLRVSDALDERIQAHVRDVQARASQAGIPEPSESAIVLALIERGLEAYAAAHATAPTGRAPKKG
jgi:hypothetical protein